MGESKEDTDMGRRKVFSFPEPRIQPAFRRPANLLLRQLRSKEEPRRRRAVEVLQTLPGNGLVAWLLPRLVKVLASRKEAERWAAYRSLVETGSAAVVPLLEALYPPGERGFRLLVVRALAESVTCTLMIHSQA